MKYMCVKYVAIFAFSVSELLLPQMLFAQSAVVAYANPLNPNVSSVSSFPTNDQLDRLTHVVISAVGPWGTGTGELFVRDLPWLSGNPAPSNNRWNSSSSITNTWLLNLANRAHSKGVKISICISGDNEDNHWGNATGVSYRSTFVANITSFVSRHGLDEVVIDWEYPRTTNNEWSQLIALLTDLRTALPSGKKITVALSMRIPTDSWWDNQTVPAQIWNAVDAIHLMTYDEPTWTTHSYASSANTRINQWATWGTDPVRNLDKKKLHVGSAFYGYKKSGSTTLWGNANKVNYVTYSAGGSHNPGDLTADASNKVTNTITNVLGGVFAYELGYDLPATNSNSLLKKIWDTTFPPPPVISGSTPICTGSPQLFSATTWQSGFYWDKSSNISLSNPTTNSTVTVSENGSGAGWVIVRNNNGDELARVNVWVGKPNSYDFSVEIIAKPKNQFTGTALPESVAPIDSYDWYLASSGWTVTDVSPVNAPANTKVAIASPSLLAEASLYVNAHNSCGWASGMGLYVGVIGPNWMRSKIPAAIYPNPVSDILNIEIDVEAIAQAKANQQTITGSVPLKVDATYDIRMYDGQGNVLRQAKTKGSTVQFNVTNLPYGIYLLHIYDGVNNTPSIQQILVEH